ncbi:MAG TPA: hypothetical protein VLK22_04025 [Candidatus Udaeobacter sp.]|nr:hypothetical protein [Candidatus Udaeobacter sp.]
MPKINLDKALIEKIINKAEAFISMPNGLTVEAAFNKAVTIFLGDKHGAWGEYKKIAKGIYLNRQKELKEIRDRSLLDGARDAALARRDAEVEEAENNNEDLSHLKGRRERENIAEFPRHTRK